jgi:MATE family multidrug resistance protein
VCNWCIGMPVAYWLAFPLGFGLHGLWWGRTVASVTSGSVLTFLWYARIRREHRAEGTHTLQLRSPLDARSGSFEPA